MVYRACIILAEGVTAANWWSCWEMGNVTLYSLRDISPFHCAPWNCDVNLFGCKDYGTRTGTNWVKAKTGPEVISTDKLDVDVCGLSDREVSVCLLVCSQMWANVRINLTFQITLVYLNACGTAQFIEVFSNQAFNSESLAGLIPSLEQCSKPHRIPKQVGGLSWRYIYPPISWVLSFEKLSAMPLQAMAS